ncbi:LptA/OstA family protein [Qipengyuania thermophila]|uniref:LptA/OstA family protein n=1 Tax=Qipengyuania thermophila TaxID=2509361 RepID=UPI001F19A840|nr:LptA/OstA family protein [Qipengyuania thermophila]
MTSLSSLAPLALRGFLISLLATLALASGFALQAQAFGNHNTNAPVNFAADRIQLQDRENRVVLSGDVVINQAALTLRAARTLINYTDAGSLQIQRMTATGGVRVTRGNETATGDVAVYDFDRRIITMSGDVRLSQGPDNLRGGRLVIDLTSGIATMDGGSRAPVDVPGAGPGRVTGTFTVPAR